MEMLQKTDPDGNHEFTKYGSWAILYAKNSFSAMSYDHCQEQHNKDLKVDGEVLRLFADDVKLLKWMVYGPEKACLSSDAVATSNLKKEKKTGFH